MGAIRKSIPYYPNILFLLIFLIYLFRRISFPPGDRGWWTGVAAFQKRTASRHGSLDAVTKWRD
jgi:hypothetical protein